jgi:hypothetical protein
VVPNVIELPRYPTGTSFTDRDYWKYHEIVIDMRVMESGYEPVPYTDSLEVIRSYG